MARIYKMNEVSAEAITPLVLSTTGVEFDLQGAADEKTAFFVTEGSGDVTVVANGIAQKDIKLTVAANKFFTLDSRYFADEEGKITLKGATTIKIALIQLA